MARNSNWPRTNGGAHSECLAKRMRINKCIKALSSKKKKTDRRKKRSFRQNRQSAPAECEQKEGKKQGWNGCVCRASISSVAASPGVEQANKWTRGLGSVSVNSTVGRFRDLL